MPRNARNAVTAALLAAILATTGCAAAIQPLATLVVPQVNWPGPCETCGPVEDSGFRAGGRGN